MTISPTAPPIDLHTSGATRSGACCPPLGPSALAVSEAEQLAVVFKALADPVRLRMLSLVMAAKAGEVCACDLPEEVGRSQSTVSHHLSQLVEAGLLRREQRGKWAWFTVDDTMLAEVAAALTSTGGSESRS